MSFAKFPPPPSTIACDDDAFSSSVWGNSSAACTGRFGISTRCSLGFKSFDNMNVKKPVVNMEALVATMQMRCQLVSVGMRLRL